AQDLAQSEADFLEQVSAVQTAQAAQESANAAIQANLWAAAQIVAQAATPTRILQPAAPPITVVPVLAPAPPPAPATVEKQPEPHPAAPALIASVRPRFDPVHWIMFI